jgi:hypothetical protein
MGAYPYLVQIAWDTVEKFLRDWQCEPYRWAQEIDIQMEIANRICSIYQTIGRDTVVGNYSGAVSGFERSQRWNRVCCEPTIQYKYTDGKIYKCKPDIVVWDDIPDPDSPPDQVEGSNWPMIWLCEIKFKGKEEENWDIEKMKYLLLQNDAKYACWLNLHRKRADTGNGIIWKKLIESERLWICTAMLPALK